MIIHFVNILPNLYWVFIEVKKDNKISSHLILNRIKQFCQLKKIDKIIRIDKDTHYWENKEKFIKEIYQQIQERNIKNIIQYCEIKSIELKQHYYDNNKILLITNNNIDSSIILFIYLFKYLSNMNWKQTLQSIQSKMSIPLIIKHDITKQLIKTII